MILRNPSDNKFLECALDADADFIISGDAHLLKIGHFESINIINPAEFLKLLSA